MAEVCAKPARTARFSPPRLFNSKNSYSTSELTWLRRAFWPPPWDYTVQEEPDPEGQATLYRAFLKAWARVPGLSGVYFYMWWGQGGPQDIGYSPKGKPAEQVLRDWLEGGAWQGQKREPI